MLRALRQNAIDSGVHPDNVHQIVNGQIVEMLDHKIKITNNFIDATEVYVSGNEINSDTSTLLKHRRALSEDGIFYVTLILDSKQRKLINLPVITSKGSFFIKGSQPLITKIVYSIKERVDTYLKRLGNDDISKNEYIEKLEALPYIGEYMDFNKDRYYCDNLTLTCTPGYINTKINYTKNYNKINEMIANPKDYVQYDIPLKESTRRITNINEYIYIQDSINNNYLDFNGEEDYDLLLRLYLGLDKTTSISLAPVIGLYKSEFDAYSENLTPATVMMPLKKFYGANSIKFQMDTYDNYSITSVRGNHKNGDKYYENYVSYVNGVGEVDRCKIGLIYTTANNGTSNNIDSSITSYYPIASNSALDFNNSYCQFNRYLNIRKDKKEALSFVFNVLILVLFSSY